MRRGLVAGLLGAVLLLAGCASGASTPPQATVTVTVNTTTQIAAGTSASASPSAGGTAAAVGGGPVVDAGGHDTVAFASPTGRINCRADQQPAAWSVRCDVLERLWNLPPKPAECQNDWGVGAYLGSTGAGLVCAGDTVGYEAVVGSDATWWNGQPGSQVVSDPRRGQLVALAYGATMQLGPIGCLSRQDGMHCTNTETGAGFDVARESYTLR